MLYASLSWLRRASWVVVGVCPSSVSSAQVVRGPVIALPDGSGVYDKGTHVLVVDDTPGCRFGGSIQMAVHAAVDGDVLVVRRGSYASFVVAGKALTVFGEPGSTSSEIRIAGAPEIRNTGADQVVVVRGLSFQGTPRCTDAAGPVWIEDCAFERGFQVSGSPALGLFDSSLRGTPALALSNASTCFSYSSDIRGSDGRDAACWINCGYYGCGCYGGFAGLPGGDGVSLTTTAQMFAFKNTLEGGIGGSPDSGSCDPPYYSCYYPGASSGFAVRLGPGTSAQVMDSTVVGGVIGGTLTSLTGTVGSYSVTSPVGPGEPATLTLTGPPGWNGFVTYSFEYAPTYLSAQKGYSVVAPESPTLFVGAFPATGMLQISLTFALPTFHHARLFFSQAKLYDTSTGTAYLAEPSALLILRDPCP